MQSHVTRSPIVKAVATGLLAVLLLALLSDSSKSAATRQGKVYVVDQRGSDRHGDGSRRHPWRTLAKACRSVPGGLRNTIRLNPGTYREARSCRLPCQTNLRGSGHRSTRVMGRADPLVLVADCMHRANVQTVSGLRLDGQNKTAGTLGMKVVDVRGLTVRDLWAGGFRGTSSGGALDIDHVWNADVGDSTFRNSAASWGTYASGTLGIRNATDSVFHDLDVYDSKYMAIKGGWTGDTLTNVEFYNVRCSVGSPQLVISASLSYPAICFEMNEMDVTGVTIRNSSFNATLSLTDQGFSSRLGSSFRYDIHNNDFELPRSSQTGGVLNYAIELDQNSSQIHHNYFNGGVNPISNFESAVKRGISIHHNVFDHQENWVALMRYRSGLFDSEFSRNTVVLRQHWFDSLFKVDELTSASTPAIRDNIFWSAYPIGDKLGLGLDLANIDRNLFHNVTARGQNALTRDPELPLAGGFPQAYVPLAGSAAAGLGAFSDGPWSVGPTRRAPR